MATDQPVSSAWYLDSINQSNSAQTWQHTWSSASVHNVTYVGWNSNGSVSIAWNISVHDATFAPEDVNQDGLVDEADLEKIRPHFNEYTNPSNQRCDVNADWVVDIYDLTLVSSKIKKPPVSS